MCINCGCSDCYDGECCVNMNKTKQNPQDGPQAGVALNDLLGCKRWHEAEIVALKGYLADEEADDSATAKSMRNNFRCKITQHEKFIKALTAVTT